ncbi:hypothetical protein BJ508DRAFT_363462 [Ascobolus immersus RN42]|uniref:Uncharacterized protein n=1 Tax=Ascobolus immersus RN42 TaxID=1160509 RepID=A0A3N4HYQ0_ASCIM|nr:hypothetical protein BJ508DRAFT_363462 [Ascobolus immersus RN42]
MLDSLFRLLGFGYGPPIQVFESRKSKNELATTVHLTFSPQFKFLLQDEGNGLQIAMKDDTTTTPHKHTPESAGDVTIESASTTQTQFNPSHDVLDISTLNNSSAATPFAIQSPNSATPPFTKSPQTSSTYDDTETLINLNESESDHPSPLPSPTLHPTSTTNPPKPQPLHTLHILELRHDNPSWWSTRDGYWIWSTPFSDRFLTDTTPSILPENETFETMAHHFIKAESFGRTALKELVRKENASSKEKMAIAGLVVEKHRCTVTGMEYVKSIVAELIPEMTAPGSQAKDMTVRQMHILYLKPSNVSNNCFWLNPASYNHYRIQFVDHAAQHKSNAFQVLARELVKLGNEGVLALTLFITHEGRRARKELLLSRLAMRPEDRNDIDAMFNPRGASVASEATIPPSAPKPAANSNGISQPTFQFAPVQKNEAPSIFFQSNHPSNPTTVKFPMEPSISAPTNPQAGPAPVQEQKPQPALTRAVHVLNYTCNPFNSKWDLDENTHEFLACEGYSPNYASMEFGEVMREFGKAGVEGRKAIDELKKMQEKKSGNKMAIAWMQVISEMPVKKAVNNGGRDAREASKETEKPVTIMVEFAKMGPLAQRKEQEAEEPKPINGFLRPENTSNQTNFPYTFNSYTAPPLFGPSNPTNSTFRPGSLF